MRGRGLRMRIFAGTTRSAILLVVRAIHSPIILRLQLPNRDRNAAGQRNEFPPIQVRGLGNPPHLPDADLEVEFVSDALSLRHLHFVPVIWTEGGKAWTPLAMMLSGSTADRDHLAIRLIVIAKVMLLRFSINNIQKELLKPFITCARSQRFHDIEFKIAAEAR